MNPMPLSYGDMTMKNSITFVYTLLFCVFIHAQDQGREYDSEEIAAIVSELVGDMVPIPAGSFLMGNMSDCDKPEKQARSMTVSFSEMDKLALSLDYTCYYETPVHRVTVPAFKMGKYEVTVAQWEACVADGGCNGYSPSDERLLHSFAPDASWARGNRPVIGVSWNDIQSFIDWLNGRTGGNFRLPTEAEWEYAARAGATTRYSWGDDIGRNRANCRGCDWWGEREGHDERSVTSPVGSFPANAWGLHDMHGNVSEWVQDCWNEYEYDLGGYEDAPDDGSAWTSDNCRWRVVRGGSCAAHPRSLNSASRGFGSPADREGYAGFRLARDE